MLKPHSLLFSLVLTGPLCFAPVARAAPAKTAPAVAASASDADWFATVKDARAIIASDAKQKVDSKTMYAARTILVLDDQLRAWGAVQREVKAFKAANKNRGPFVGVAVPAPTLARIGAARKQTARLRALGKAAPAGMYKARDHFANSCEAVDDWLDASKSLFATNDQKRFEKVEQRAFRVANRANQAGVAAMKAALEE